LATISAPASTSRVTTTASASGTRSAKNREPQVVSTPAVSMLSFTPTRTPASGPSAACGRGGSMVVTTALVAARTAASRSWRVPGSRLTARV
jgi:hypothetical protein